MKNVALYGRGKDGKFIVLEVYPAPAPRRRDWFPMTVTTISLLTFIVLAVSVFKPGWFK
jgi:hypothetical protein